MLMQTIKKWQKGIDAYKAGNYSEAASSLKAIDDTSKILFCLGIVYYKQNNFIEASQHFAKSVQCDPFLSISYFMLGTSCYMKNDISSATLHFDQAIQALRGHEYIDYKQIGMDFRLLLCEILFNKALCMKSGGVAGVAQVMKQATACKIMRDPSARYRFDDLCNEVAAGDFKRAQPYTTPLDIMFNPPKVKDRAPGKEALPARPPPNTPSARPSTAGPSGPLAPLRSPTISTSAPATLSNIPPPVPPKKKLPSRPISLKVGVQVMTLKCFYKDRRLIQIPGDNPNLEELHEKIAAKFGVEGLEIRYCDSSGEMSQIRNLNDLCRAIDERMTEVYLRLEGETNEFETQAASATSSSASPRATTPPAIPAKPGKIAKVAAQPAQPARPATDSKPTTNLSPQPTPFKINLKPTTPTQTSTSNSNPKPTSPTKATSQPIAMPVLVTSPKPTTPTFETPPKKISPAKIEKKQNVWQECYTDDGEKYFFNTETEETSWDPDIDPTPPWMICFTESGDKYYYNPDTDASSWEFPG